MSHESIVTAAVVLPCPCIEDTLPFFVEQLGFRVAEIFPADNPSVAVIDGHGLRIRLDAGEGGDPGTLSLRCTNPEAVLNGASAATAPNGTRIVVEDAEPPLVVTPLVPSVVVSRRVDRRPDSDLFATGRAGMRYRDLIPDRQGARFIASHIQIPEGGPVPDYVHYHNVQFQLIFCKAGWVRVVYEDQGQPFVLNPGDCVLQPPGIRHRVLESSPGLEVVEFTCPANHRTLADPALELPTTTIRPDRQFSGQRFVRHQRTTAAWAPWRADGWEATDTGIAAATGGLVDVRVARPTSGVRSLPPRGAHWEFAFVLSGSAQLCIPPRAADAVESGDSWVAPAAQPYNLDDASADLELLTVSVPGE